MRWVLINDRKSKFEPGISPHFTQIPLQRKDINKISFVKIGDFGEINLPILRFFALFDPIGIFGDIKATSNLCDVYNFVLFLMANILNFLVKVIANFKTQ